MPILGPLHSFDASSLGRAPDVAGVFALYEGRELTYYGHALESLRARIRAHLLGEGGACIQRAVLFNFEVTDQPERREFELIQEHQAQHGSLPKCNALLL